MGEIDILACLKGYVRYEGGKKDSKERHVDGMIISLSLKISSLPQNLFSHSSSILKSLTHLSQPS